MSYGAGMDDCVLILHMDRKDHILMNYAQQIDRLPIFEQEAVALFVSKGSFFSTITINLKKNHTVYTYLTDLLGGKEAWRRTHFS